MRTTRQNGGSFTPSSMPDCRFAHRLRTQPVNHAGQGIPVRQTTADRFSIERQLLIGTGAARHNPASEIELAPASECLGILGYKLQGLGQEFPHRLGGSRLLVDEAAVDPVTLGAPAIFVVDGARS